MSWGGGGSSKSYTQAQYEVVKCLERKERILILRKVAATLKDSVIPLMWENILGGWNMQGDWIYNKSDRTMTNKINGSQIIFRGMDDPEKIKSIQGVTRVWFEEVTEFDEADINQVNIRLRGNSDLQLTGTFNPIDELHWLKKKFFDNPPKNVTLIHTTYLDNKFIDEAYKLEIESYQTRDPNFYRVYGLGNWGRLTQGGEFYKRFDVSKHIIEPVERDAGKVLHITFDENVNPYVTLNIWQGEGKRVWQIDEINLEDPRNTLADTLKEFYSRYKPNGTRIFIYGDPSSNKADVKLEKGVNFYALVEKFLIERKYIWERHVQSSAPNVELRGNFINAIFEENYDGCEVFFCSNCKITIADYQYLKQDSDGGKFKEMARNPTTKVAYQKWGHSTDANDYFLTEYFAESYELFQSPEAGVRYVLQRRKSSKRY